MITTVLHHTHFKRFVAEGSPLPDPVGDPTLNPLVRTAAFMIVAAGTIALFAALFVLTFGLVRMRANYNPRALGLEGGSSNFVGPRLRSLFATIRRTYRLEGAGGLFKGIIPTLIVGLILSVVSVVASIVIALFHPSEGGMMASVIVINLVLVIAAIPGVILINRCIVTPYRLHGARATLNAILSPYENSHVFALFPVGLIAAVLLQLLLLAAVPGVHTLIHMLPLGGEKSTYYIRRVLLVSFQALSTLWLCPLEVVIAKLSVQPNLGGEEYDPDTLLAVETRCSKDEDDVITLRPASEPYTGLVDCFRKVCNEEGWTALYRGWIWTLLGAVGIAANMMVQAARGK